MNEHLPKKLYRSHANRIFAGVLGGIAEYFETDPVLVRVGFLVLLVLTGFFPFGVLYLLLWLVIPQKS